MPRKTTYTPEMQAFIAENVKGRRYAELAKLMSARFGITFTASQMHAYAQNHHLSNGMPTGPLVGERPLLFPEPILTFIRENAEGRTTAELQRLVNATFGTEYTESQTRQVKQRNHIQSGVDTRIKPGSIPPNKGKKGYCAPGCEKSWFQKGHEPNNHLPVGSEVMRTDGYLQVKIAEPNVWKLKHILIWEEANGPVPKGSVLLFLDGNHRNTALENLTLISRAELARLNQRGLIKDDAELTQSGVLVARLISEIGKAKKKKKGESHE